MATRRERNVGRRMPTILLVLTVAAVGVLLLLNAETASVRAEAQRAPLRAPQRLDQTATPVPTTVVTLTPLQALEEQLQIAWQQQDWLTAIDIINQILQIDPNHAGMRDNLYAAHVNQGFQYYNEAMLVEAKTYFTRATEIRPENCSEAQYGLSLIQAAILTVTPWSAPTATTVPPPSPGTTTTPHTTDQHLVKTGDTLYSLAKHYGTTVSAIMRANALTSYIIRVGQTLVIRSADDPVTGPTIHTILPGETLWSIARSYQTTVQAIMLANRLWDYTIYAGELLIIPGPSEPSAPTEPTIHTVAAGETLYSVAQRYQTTVSAIMEANRLADTTIHPGDLLIIPAGP